MSYPLFLDVTGRRAVVVGGGPVAARRAKALVEQRAEVVVVAPQVCEDLADLVDSGAISLVAREYAAGDLAGAWLVHTATGDRRVDAQVASHAEAARVWWVRADAAAESSAWTPAVARATDGVAVAVSGGGDPGRAKAVRDAVALALDSGTLPLRRTRARRESPGTVWLVGGGPGTPGLITVLGRQALARADVVVVDRLAPRALLDELGPDVEVIDCGKAPGRHQLTQDQINQVIVERALAGLDVVRLKGGDPFVLGRGGEEALACRAAGVPVRVVPGVTSAVSVPAAAGIPVTHRGVASGFAVLSGHEGIEAWAGESDVTLVLLMGVTQLRASAAAVVASGRAPSTPVALVERGWSDQQRTTVGTLADIADVAEREGVTSPAVVVIGDVVALRAGLALDAPPRGAA